MAHPVHKTPAHPLNRRPAFGEHGMVFASEPCITPEAGASPMTYEHTEELYLHRNKSVAKSFYRQLKGEGFTHQQIIELSTTLLDLVTEDLRDEAQPN